MKDLLTLGIGLLAGSLLTLGLIARVQIQEHHWMGQTVSQMILENARIDALERIEGQPER